MVGTAPSGIMFHHFVGDGHPPIQGALNQDRFDTMIQEAKNHNLVSAGDWYETAIKGQLTDHLCLTFDDNLLSQFDLALPVLEAHNLTAFWFVYTGPYEGAGRELELFRFFRNIAFPDVADFYTAFDEVAAEQFGALIEVGLQHFDPAHYLTESQFYTDTDRKFRFIRDQILGETKYFQVMHSMIEQSQFDETTFADKIWMPPASIKALQGKGHMVGLHSHTHPTDICRLSAAEQYAEFQQNSETLSAFTGDKPVVMSHPNGRYNQDTLNVLSELDIQIGFRADSGRINGGPFEHARLDQADFFNRYMS